MANTGFDFADLQFELGNYFNDQKQYHLAEDYYLKVLTECRKRAEANPYPSRKSDVATTLNNVAVLHKNLTRYDEAENEYNEALAIRRELAEANRDSYIGDVAQTLNNLGNLHQTLTRYDEAEKEYNEALKIRRELAETNRDAYIGKVAQTLFNIAYLQAAIDRKAKAKETTEEALGIYMDLAKAYPQIWGKDVEDTEQWLKDLSE